MDKKKSTTRHLLNSQGLFIYGVRGLQSVRGREQQKNNNKQKKNNNSKKKFYDFII